MASSKSSRAPPGDDKFASPPRRRGTVGLVKRLAQLQHTDPGGYPAAYAKLKETVPELDHLLDVLGPPPASARTPSSGAAPAATPRSDILGASFQGRRRSTPSFSPPLDLDGVGGSLLDISAISGIAGDDNEYNDLEQFLTEGSERGRGGGGGSNGGKFGGDSGRGTAVSRYLDGGLLRSLSPTRAASSQERTAAAAAATSAAVEAMLMSSTFLPREEGGATASQGRRRPPTSRASPNTARGSGGLGGGKEKSDDDLLVHDGNPGLGKARLNDTRGDIQQILSELPPLPSEGATSKPPPDVQDVRCVCFLQPILLRGCAGQYLRIREADDDEGEDIDDNASTTTAATGFSGGGEGVGATGFGAGVGSGAAGGGTRERKMLFGVEADGIGTGDPAEVVFFVSATKKHNTGPIVYGESVSIKSPYGRGKFLRVGAFGTVVLARIHAGRNERWKILPCSPVGGPSPTGSSSVGRGGAVDGGRQAREDLMGSFVRKGQRIELEHTEPSGPRKGTKTWLMMRPREIGGGWEVVSGSRREGPRVEEYVAWEILPAGVPYLPAWRRDRRYLTGDFLLDPPRKKPSRAVAKLFGIDPREVEAIDYGENSGAAGEAEAFSPESRAQLPEAVQEELLLHDLLYALMGFAGSYVVVKGVGGAARQEAPKSLSNLEFAIDRKSVDPSLAYLAKRVLPLCSNYVRVSRFAAERGQYEFGKVAHALAAGMQRLLREYLVLVAQLENQLLQGKLSLQRLWFYVQPSMRTMETLEALTVELRDLKGGEMLRRIRNFAGTGGDEASRQLHIFLFHQASVPYFEMLETWIYHGDLNDQYGEFMIAQADDVHKGDVEEDFNTRYWSGRYLLRANHVIASLDSRKEKILTTGKYLNVVRECGRRVDCPLAGAIPADPGGAGEGLYAKIIDGAYGFASRCLMDLVVREGELLLRLKSIKHYFLLDRGEFFEHFLDCAETELDRTIPQISCSRLESLLHLSVQMSSASQDPFREDLGLVFSSQNLLKHLEMIHRHGGTEGPHAPGVPSRTGASMGVGTTPEAGSAPPSVVGGGEYVRRIIQGTAELRGVEGLMLTYKVRWPLSLVLSKKNLTKYQLLFRHVFFAKHVLRLLSKRLMDHQDAKQLELRGLMTQSYLLRQRMVHFMQNLVYYMMVEVIEPRWHEFMDDLRKLCQEKGEAGIRGLNARDSEGGNTGDEGGTLDDVLKRHNQFQDTCLKECLLTNVGLLKSLIRVMISCLHFGDQGALFTEKLRLQEEAERVADEARDAAGPGAVKAGLGPGGVRQERGATKGLSGTARTAYFQRRSSSMRAALDTAEYREYIRQSQEGFDASLHEFARQLWRDAAAHYHSHLNNLCTRLDYNGFFSERYGAGNFSPAQAAAAAAVATGERRESRTSL